MCIRTRLKTVNLSDTQQKCGSTHNVDFTAFLLCVDRCVCCPGPVAFKRSAVRSRLSPPRNNHTERCGYFDRYHRRCTRPAEMNPACTGGGRRPRRLRSADAPPAGTSMPQYVQTGAAVFQRPHLRMRPFSLSKSPVLAGLFHMYEVK